MMNNMMKAVIRGMSVDEREEMMLNMMPSMMKKVDPGLCTKNMLIKIGSKITVYSVVSFIVKVIKDEELKQVFKGKLKGLKGKKPAMMIMMMPFMKRFMSGMMPEMMKFMMPMMSEMMCGTDDNGCSMEERFDMNPEMNEKMSQCMQKMIPVCVENITPVIPKDERKKFALQMINLFTKAGKTDLNSEETKEFISSAINSINE